MHREAGPARLVAFGGALAVAAALPAMSPADEESAYGRGLLT
jgi:hypothetical protein